MEKEEFERIAQEIFDTLPDKFRSTIDNVRIIIEDTPGDTVRWRSRVGGGNMLLGLYEGVPLNKRGSSYGMYAAVPDTITLFKDNIESLARSDEEVRGKIREVLVHEIGHYFGMTEEEIRKAGY